MYMPKDGKVNEMPNPKTAEEIFAEKDVKIAALEGEAFDRVWTHGNQETTECTPNA